MPMVVFLVWGGAVFFFEQLKLYISNKVKAFNFVTLKIHLHKATWLYTQV